MTLRVLYFASLRDRTGTASESIDLPVGTTAAALWSMLAARHPRLAEVRVRPMVACDMAYATWETTLDGVGEVAFLPPMSGG